MPTNIAAIQNKKVESTEDIIRKLKNKVHDLEEELSQKEDFIDKMKKLQMEHQERHGARKPSLRLPPTPDSPASYRHRHETKTLFYNGWDSLESPGLGPTANEPITSQSTTARVGVAVTCTYVDLEREKGMASQDSSKGAAPRSHGSRHQKYYVKD